MRVNWAGWYSYVLAVTTLVFAPVVRGETGGYAAERAALESAYRREGVFRRLGAHFVTRARGVTLSLGAPPRGAATKRCRALIVLAPRPLRFRLESAAGRLGPLLSHAGTLAIDDCERGLSKGTELRLAMLSRRGAVDIFELFYDDERTPIGAILPRRAGTLPPEPIRMPGLQLGPVAARVQRARQSALYDGAERVELTTYRVGAGGELRVGLRLREGCHRLALIADGAKASAPVDVDAFLASAELPPRIVDRDRSHAPDGRLEACTLGGAFALEVAGASAGGALLLVDATWSIPNGISRRWGKAVVAGLAHALRRKRAPPMTEPPTQTYLGGPGDTVFAVETEPGRCYVAAVAATGAKPEALRLLVQTGGELRVDEALEAPFAGSVAFCANGERRTKIEVEVRAQGGLFVLSLWPLPGATR